MGRELGHTLRCPALYDDAANCHCIERRVSLLTHDQAVGRWGEAGLKRRVDRREVWPEPKWAAYWVEAEGEEA